MLGLLAGASTADAVYADGEGGGYHCVVKLDEAVDVLEAVQDAREDFGLNDNLSQIDGVLGDLSEALADVAVKLSIGVADKSGEVWHGTLVNDGLNELLTALHVVEDAEVLSGLGRADGIHEAEWLLLLKPETVAIVRPIY